MSDELESSTENFPETSAESAPPARKTATRRPKKTVTPIEPATTETAAPPTEDPQPSDPPEVAGGEWPEPEAESSGGDSAKPEVGKRKRRRRKGKGQAPQAENSVGSQSEDAQPGGTKPADAAKEQAPRPTPPPQPRSKIDPEHLAKMAWKIYLAEVSEEGVALISDSDAKDLSRRCFRLAEIFIEEQFRRR